MSNPALYNLEIYQGETFTLTLTATTNGSTPSDLTGYVAKSEVRESYNASQAVLTFSASSGLGSNGVISLSSATANTNALDPNKKYVYDLKIDSSGSITPILKGTVTVFPRVTR